jgi:predicted ATPase
VDGKLFIRSLKAQNLLSFGEEGVSVDMQPLNVLIGPNSSGKSNFVEMFGLLKAAPRDLTVPIREGGGINEWLWKGAEGAPTAEIEATVLYPRTPDMALRYTLALTMIGQRMQLMDEALENEERTNPREPDVHFYYRYQHGNPVINVNPRSDGAPTRSPGTTRYLQRQDLLPDQSVLAQRKDPDQYPELTYVGDQFSKIRLYREWNLGRFTAPRLPQKPDLPEDFLLDDASNLGIVWNDLEHRPGLRRLLLEKLSRLHDAIEDVTTKIHGGTVQLMIHERGLREPIPATRLSDGTLRYLCLLTILCHPSPPPLICIEEPELGLHPDILSTIAELLIDASQRTQLVVTTHSDQLVAALSDVPEALLICERKDTGSTLRRLAPEQLRAWLEDYSLGDLWRMGEIGGTRW